MKSLQFSNGIALIMVLMLSVILSLIGFSIQSRASYMLDLLEKQQIKTRLSLESESQTQNKIFELMQDQNSFNSISHQSVGKLNIAPLGEVKSSVLIQDHSSLVTLPDIDVSTLKRVLAQVISSTSELDQAADSYFDWVDSDSLRRLHGWEEVDYRRAGRIGPSNGYLTNVNELQLIRGFEQLDVEVLKKLFTVHPVYNLDLAYASNELLSVYYSDDIVQRLLEAKANGTYSKQFYQQLTGVRSETNSIGLFYVQIKVSLEYKGVKHVSDKTLRLAPFHPIPIIML